MEFTSIVDEINEKTAHINNFITYMCTVHENSEERQFYPLKTLCRDQIKGLPRCLNPVRYERFMFTDKYGNDYINILKVMFPIDDA